MAKPPYQDSRSVQLEGPAALKGLKLARFSGREAISEPFEYELLLLGADASNSIDTLDPDTVLGQSVTVALIVGSSGNTRYFNGIVTEFGYMGPGLRYHQYRAVLRPSLWLLTRRADCRVFQNKTTGDILADVVERAGSFPYKLALSGQYEKWEYRVQYRESDFDFVSRLLEHEGIYYYFEHRAGKHELVLTDDVGRLTSAVHYDKVPFYPRTDNPAQRERDHLNAWAVNKSFEAAGFVGRDYNFENGSAAMVPSGASVVAGRKDSKKYEIFDYPAGPALITIPAMEQLAKRRAERLYTAQSIAHGEGDAAGLGAGRLFELSFERDDHPHGKKKWLIVSTVCTLTSDTGQTGDADASPGAPQFSLRLTAVEANAPYRPERVTPRPLVQGTQTAQVVGPTGEEIYTDQHARVKVQFHWDRTGKHDDNSSCWVRVAQGWAGKGWGSLQVPRIGQEVVVSFLEGDPDRPLVIGSVYNAGQKPPYELPDNATQSGIKSRSKDGTAENFNELRFEDKKGSEQVYLHAEKDLVVMVENDQTLTVGAKKDQGNRTVSVQHDDKLTVANDLTVTVKGKEARTVTNDRATTAQANDSLKVGKQYKLEAGEQISLQCGAAKIVLKSDGTVEISGSTLKLSGTQKVAVDGTQTAISGSDISLSGTKTAVQGSTSLDLSSAGVASLKGSATKIG